MNHTPSTRVEFEIINKKSGIRRIERVVENPPFEGTVTTEVHNSKKELLEKRVQPFKSFVSNFVRVIGNDLLGIDNYNSADAANNLKNTSNSAVATESPVMVVSAGATTTTESTRF